MVPLEAVDHRSAIALNELDELCSDLGVDVHHKLAVSFKLQSGLERRYPLHSRALALLPQGVDNLGIEPSLHRRARAFFVLQRPNLLHGMRAKILPACRGCLGGDESAESAKKVTQKVTAPPAPPS